MIILLLVEISVLLILIFNFVSGFVSVFHGVPYVPMDRSFVRSLLEFGGVKPEDTFYDLGSGDGRVLIAAAKDFGVHEGKGFEVAPWPYFRSLWRIRRAQVQHVSVSYGNFFDQDLSKATFVYAYLFPKLNQKLAIKLAKELKSGSRVLCPAFHIETDIRPEFRLIKEEKIGKLTAYLYERV